jgi:hypothetical protein
MSKVSRLEVVLLRSYMYFPSVTNQDWSTKLSGILGTVREKRELLAPASGRSSQLRLPARGMLAPASHGGPRCLFATHARPCRATSWSTPTLISRGYRSHPSTPTCMHAGPTAASRWQWLVGPTSTFKHQIYFCNIQIKLLQRTSKTDKRLEHTIEISLQHVQTSRSTFENIEIQ